MVIPFAIKSAIVKKISLKQVSKYPGILAQLGKALNFVVHSFVLNSGLAFPLFSQRPGPVTLSGPAARNPAIDRARKALCNGALRWKGLRAMRQGFPPASKGMVIGLLGGSFDPAHEGHAHITREALKRMNLDRVWWLISPGNPLKARQPAPMAARLKRARMVMPDPKVVITGLEASLGTRATADTIDRLQAIYPGVRFVWLMGADNLVQFHRWDRWRDILRAVPVGVLARPGSGVAARLSVAARAFRVHRVSRGEGLGGRKPPVWCFVNLPLNKMSSSAIRARGGWTR
jgi:nicotinate-nucleotide adenylyltransferase